MSQRDTGDDRGGGGRGGRGRGGRGRGNTWSGSSGQGRGGPYGQGQHGNRGGDGRGGDHGRNHGGSRPAPPAGVFSQTATQHYTQQGTSKIENDSFGKSKSTSTLNQLQMLKLSDSQVLPMRPDYGTQGKPVILFANYFEIVPKKSVPMHRYSVTVLNKTEEQQPKGKKLARIIQLLLEQLPQGPMIVTDYSANIITSQTFASPSAEYLIDYSLEGDVGSRNAQKFGVRVDYNTTLDLDGLLRYLASTDLNTPVPTSKQDLIQAMNVIIGHGLKVSPEVIAQKNRYFTFGQNGERFDLKSCLNAYRGYFLSTRAATGRMLLNIQVKHLATYQPIQLAQIIAQLLRENYSQSKIESFIRKVRVKLTHLPGNRIKSVSGFASQNDGRNLEHSPVVGEGSGLPRAHEVKFWKDDEGKYITVAQYFQQTYRRPSNGFVINLGSRDTPTYLPAEVCTIVDGQPFRFQIPPAQTADMIRIAVRKPHENAESISGKGRDLIRQFSVTAAERFGFEIGRALIKVDGRVLKSPSINYLSAASRPKRIDPKEGRWNMAQVSFTQGVSLPAWGVLWVKLANWDNVFENLKDLGKCTAGFEKMLNQYGVVGETMVAVREIDIDSEETCENPIRDRFQAAKEHGWKLILFVLPKKSTTIYNTIKRLGDIEYGLHTICVTAQKFGQYRHTPPKDAKSVQNAQLFANVALKFNLKLGGSNQVLEDFDLSFVKDGKTMLVGLDVTHPAPGEDNAPSVAAIVASIDKHLGQWPADVRIQQRRQEMVSNLRDMFTSRLKLWQRHNRNALPNEIIIYRDGVSEGQYDIVLNTELPQIRQGCAALYPADRTKSGYPYITVVIVGKRHHTRFYPTDSSQADSGGNPQNGTIVDRGVTESRHWDFYLQAHTAIKGTARPAHYVVVHDEIFRRRVPQGTSRAAAADALEKFTHNLCYLFGRATKAVSICPPAYYADIACERARCWLSRVFGEGAARGTVQSAQDREVLVHDDLKNSMFYI